MVAPFSSPPTTHGVIWGATRRAVPVFSHEIYRRTHIGDKKTGLGAVVMKREQTLEYRLILPVALLSLTACAYLPSSSPPPAKQNSPTAWLKPLKREIPDSPPPVNPQVLRSIEQLNMPTPSRTLSYLELEGALSNKRENWQERVKYVLSRDPASGQQRWQRDTRHQTADEITWRGLFILSGTGQQPVGRTLVTAESVSFRGDWQKMPVGGELGYTTQGTLLSQRFGDMSDNDPKVVDCTVVSQMKASALHPALKGMAKALSCERKLGIGKALSAKHYYYLVDYGLFYHATTHEYGRFFEDRKVSAVR